MPVNSFWPWTDGHRVVRYGTTYIKIGGWNPAAFTPDFSTNQIWISTNEGLTWTLIGNAPWTPRHSFFAGIIANKLWVAGSDLFLGLKKDIWSFDLTQPLTDLDEVSAWVNVTNDWGSLIGDRVLFASCTMQDRYIVFAGGQDIYTVGATMFTNVVKYDTQTSTASLMGELPIDWFSTGDIVDTGSYLLAAGGGQYIEPLHDHFNNTIIKIEYNGEISTIGTVSAQMNGYMYANLIWHSNMLWFLNGAAPDNKTGLFYWKNSSSWIKTAQNPVARHASSFCNIDANNFLIVSGNETNDVLKITRTTI